jgi:hypothetical protein
MGFFDTYGAPISSSPARKAKTTQELLKQGIALQRGILNGKPVFNGKSKLRSWFRDGTFAPKVGQFTLFDKKSVHIGSTDHNKVLTDFEQALDRGEFDSFIKEIERKKMGKAVK